jgi:hypothetical protein
VPSPVGLQPFLALSRPALLHPLQVSSIETGAESLSALVFHSFHLLLVTADTRGYVRVQNAADGSMLNTFHATNGAHAYVLGHSDMVARWCAVHGPHTALFKLQTSCLPLESTLLLQPWTTSGCLLLPLPLLPRQARPWGTAACRRRRWCTCDS